MITYRIEYSERAVREAAALDSSVLLRIRSAIEGKLALDPTRFGKPLRYSLKGIRVLRVGDWRIAYEIRARSLVILSVWHRSKGYDEC